ncbi:MAG: hypothetical protein Q8Q20_00715, partial [bacterium]|nr:hypothetical protein [bacterium]
SNTPASNSNQNTNPSSENRNLPIIVNNSGNDDADRDGLKDSEEAEIGTDPNLSDTDSDGLSDTQELRIYGSDPLKADSDGDGFDDGEEVASGFDPAGPGQLFDIDSETN